MSRCRDCKFAEFQKTPTGRLKHKPGRCTVLVPTPVLLCIQAHSPIYVNKCAIWPEYEGQCDLFRHIE